VFYYKLQSVGGHTPLGRTVSSAESSSKNVRDSPYATTPRSWSSSGVRPKLPVPISTQRELLSYSSAWSQEAGYATAMEESDEHFCLPSNTVSSVSKFDLLGPPGVDEKNQTRSQLLMNRLAAVQQLPIDFDAPGVDQSVSSASPIKHNSASALVVLFHNYNRVSIRLIINSRSKII